MVAAGPAGHLDRVEDHLGAHMRRDPPPDDHAGERVDDEAHIGDAGPGRHECQISDPEPIGRRCGELPFHEVRVPRRRRIRSRRLDPLRPPRAFDPRDPHQPGGLVPADRDPRTSGGFPELADPVNAVVGLPDLDQLWDQLLVPQGTRRGGAGLGGVVAARSHLQQSADELDSEATAVHDVVFVRVDERDYFR